MGPRGTYDIVVLGAGPAGSALALRLARRGRRVALIEAGDDPPDPANPWRVALAKETLDAIACAVTPAPATPGRGRPLRVTSADGASLRVEGPALPSVDGVALVRALRAAAVAGGAQLLPHTRLLDATTDARGRVTRAILGGPQGPFELRAALFVDATGAAARLAQFSPALARDCPPPDAGERVATVRARYRIADPAAARRAPDPALVIHPGRAGAPPAFAALTPDPEGHGATATILAAPEQVRALALALPNRFPWLGEPRLHPPRTSWCRRPYDRLVAPGVALIGRAAGQVAPLSGHGVAASLLAARALEAAIADHDDPGSQLVLWRYQATFHRHAGAGLAAQAALWRCAWRIDDATVRAALERRVVHEGSWAQLLALIAAPAPLPRGLVDALALASAAPRHPRMAAQLTRLAMGLEAVRLHWARHPPEIDEGALTRWSVRAAALTGGRPDLHVARDGETASLAISSAAPE